MDDAERAEKAQARLELLERRPELELEAARSLRSVVSALEAGGVMRENFEAQRLAVTLERAAMRLEAWAKADRARVASVHAGMAARSRPSAAARAVVDRLREELGEGGRPS